MDPLVIVIGGVLLALLLILSLRPLPGLRDAAVLVEAARGTKGKRCLEGCDGQSEAAWVPGREEAED